MKIDGNTRALLACFSDGPSGLVFWAFRYFLGRMTIHTCCFARELAAAWPYLGEREQASIRRELDQAFADDDRHRETGLGFSIGHECDRAAWQEVRDVYNA